jgi:DNA gyrase subunit B
VTFWPDAAIFEEVEFRAQTIVERLQVMAFLNKGLEINFVDERPDASRRRRFRYTGGIVDYVKHLNSSKEPLFRKVCSSSRRGRPAGRGRAAVEHRFHESIYSFANGISTVEGGMHEEGFKKALTNVVNRYARAKGQLKEKRRQPSQARTSARVSRRSSRCACAIRSSRARPRRSSATSRCARWSSAATNEKLGGVAGGEPARGEPDRAEGTLAARARVAARQARDLTRRKSALDGAGFRESSSTASRVTRASRAVHRRGKLRRQLGEAGSRPPDPGDPPDQREDPERREGPGRQDAEEHEIQALISAIGAGCRRGLRRREDPLPQGHRPGRRRRRRLAHPHAVAHVLLPPDEAARRGRYVYVAQPPLYSTLVGKEKVYLKDDAAESEVPGGAPEPQQGVQAPEGPRRDGLRGAARHDHGRVTPVAAAGQRGAGERSPTRCARSSWATTSSSGAFIQTNAKDVRFLDI